ncbi:MAG TPA: hypothetical protein VH678_15940 [Xanthobacteraceae bacterium]|jgi:hypothetical protein
MSEINFDNFARIDDARQWRNRAEEMRVIADDMISVANRVVARRLADSYEELATRAEEQAKSKKHTDI